MPRQSQMVEPKDESWLYRELRASTERQKRHLALYKEIRKEYTSCGWESGSEDEALGHEYDPENMAYVYVTGQVGEMLAGTPEFVVESRHATVDEKMRLELLGGEFAMNQWLRDSEFRRSREMLAYDLLFAGAMGYMSETVNPYTYRKSDAPEGWPSFERVSPEDQLKDPLAKSREEGRFTGHQWTMPKKDLVELAEERAKDGWDVEQVKALVGMDTDNANFEGLDRDNVRVAELWFPGYELKSGNPWKAEPTGGPKRGQHGTLFTLAVDESKAQKTHGKEGIALLRKPRPYYGYREGPYVWGDVNLVPDSAYGLAPLIATYGQRMDLNRVAKAISRAIREFKRLTGVDVDVAPELEAKIKSGEFDSIVPISGAGGRPLNQLVAMIEAGGLPPEGMVYLQMKLESWFRNQGLGEAQTGRADAGATATAVAVATTESQRRSQRVLVEWAQMNQSIGDRLAFFVLTSKEVKIGLDASALREAGAPPGYDGFQGGGISPEEYDALAIKLDTQSLTPPTPEMLTQQALMGHEIMMGALQGMAQFPIPQFWVPYMEQLGRRVRIPHMREAAESFLVGVTALIQQNAQAATAPAPPAPQVKLNVGGGASGGSTTQRKPMQGGSPGKGLQGTNGLLKRAGGQPMQMAGAA